MQVAEPYNTWSQFMLDSAGGFLYGKHKEAEEDAYQRGLQQGRQGR